MRARGAVVDEAALVAALQSGHIAEATLDVFAVEPLPQGIRSGGWSNVLITPHLASITVPEERPETLRKASGRCAQGRARSIASIRGGVIDPGANSPPPRRPCAYEALERGTAGRSG